MYNEVLSFCNLSVNSLRTKPKIKIISYQLSYTEDFLNRQEYDYSNWNLAKAPGLITPLLLLNLPRNL